jgi:TfoX/Sxy family transcriptional regulator of competence genes
MAWRKSPPALIELFASALPADPRIEPRKMFGYPAAFLNGNLFSGLHQESFILRLPEAAREQVCAKHGATEFEPMPGRKMREYVALPAVILGNRKSLAAWLAKSIAYVGAMPAKKKPAKKKTRR